MFILFHDTKQKWVILLLLQWFFIHVRESWFSKQLTISTMQGCSLLSYWTHCFAIATKMETSCDLNPSSKAGNLLSKRGKKLVCTNMRSYKLYHIDGFFFWLLLLFLWIMFLLVKSFLKTAPNLCSCSSFAISIPHKSINLLLLVVFMLLLLLLLLLIPSEFQCHDLGGNFSIEQIFLGKKNSNNLMPPNFFVRILESKVQVELVTCYCCRGFPFQ